MIAVALLATLVAAMTLPYAITLVANIFQTMISHATATQNGTQDDEAFLRSMHAFGIHYSCVGIVLFIGGYVGTAFMKITALNQVCEPLYLCCLKMACFINGYDWLTRY